jgi:diguanylate cyclase (GGDEF)-like protein/PAS domain S-box-containing protein
MASKDLAQELQRSRIATETADERGEQRFRDYFQLQSIGMAIAGPDKHWIEVNDKLCDLLGYTREELLNVTWMALTHPDDLARNLGLFAQAMCGDINGYSLEKRFIRKDGSQIDVHLSTRCVRKTDGQVDYFIATYEDITERKRADRALRESEERFRNLIEGSIEGILIHRDWRPLFANQAFADMLGFPSPDEILKMDSIAPIIAAHERERLRGYRDARIRGEAAPTTYEHDAVRKDGAPIVLQTTVRVVNWLGERAFQNTSIEVTERKRAEQALRESEERFRQLIEGSIQGVLIERYRKPLFANQALANILGYSSPAEILGLGSIEPHVAPHERVRLQRYAEARFAHQPAPVHYEYDAVRRDGSIVTLENVARLVTWQGEPAIQSTVIDVSDRKRAEAALGAVIDAVPAMINAKDIQSRYVFMNRYQAELYGVAPEDAIGKTATELLGAEYGAYTEKLDREVLVAGEPTPYFEEDYVDAHGVSHTFLTTKVPMREAHGQIASVATISLDITPRKEAERALRESEERYRALYENNPSMYFTVAPDGSVLSVNPFGAQQFGYTREELLGTSIFDLFHTKDRSKAEQVLAHVVDSLGEVSRTELRQVHKAGNLLWVRMTARAIDDVEGRRVVLIVCEDITATLQLSEELSYQASHDALTGLFNRREFDRRLQQLLSSAATGQTEHALCYLDLDQFKIINDICGHVAGDQLLRELGQILKGKIRQRDALARLGGDEFGLLLEDCSLRYAERVANEMQKAVHNFRFIWEGRTFSIGVSIGLVPIGRSSENVTTLLSKADAACYAAKDAGRNRIHVYHDSDTDLARRQGEMRLVSRINQALERDHFHLAFQPITPILSTAGAGAHYELLIRMQDENGRVVPPRIFLAAAERYNLSTKVDNWVIATAFRWLTRHPEQLTQLFLCSTNLSGHSLGDENFLKFIIQQFEQTNLPPEKICFEITETAAIANLASATQFINSLKALGCRFALDDFGSGLSSFAYLKNLPVDFIKIDGVFVKDITHDPIALAMVHSINEIGHVMGKQTIAEFVETEGILQKLREIGVDYAQGYGIGRPQPIEQLP